LIYPIFCDEQAFLVSKRVFYKLIKSEDLIFASPNILEKWDIVTIISSRLVHTVVIEGHTKIKTVGFDYTVLIEGVLIDYSL
jgi:hypothetical protein